MWAVCQEGSAFPHPSLIHQSAPPPAVCCSVLHRAAVREDGRLSSTLPPPTSFSLFESRCALPGANM